ncbi:type-1 angiotensin II receptor-associated protein-like [Acanthaster planci]|uniref:Type-1 angiotensin II receptor-associated protein-like n=1 Tax=Acanthaster planci TaxID=133434 RepID=A0A8B7YA48_ACAPL|nr:type-1 angiotensin II receptor-associated protein-like [Acanthaster planci]
MSSPNPLNLPLGSIMDKWVLKIIVATHFLLTVWAQLGVFLPSGYEYMNIILILTGLWAVAMPESKDSMHMFFIFHLMSILTDIIFLGVFFGPSQDSLCSGITTTACSNFRFSAGMAIINLIIKPLSAIFLFMELRRRSGAYTGFPGHPGSSGYENIDQPIPTNQQVEAAQPHQSALDKPYLPQ